MRFNEPHQPRDLEDTLIPLINVVFLMLIFFMLAGQVRAPDALRIEPPRSDQGQSDSTDAILVLLDASGRVALDGEVLADEVLAERISQRLAAWRATRQQAGGSSAPDTVSTDAASTAPTVTLKADAQVRHRQLRQLLDQLRAAGVEQVQLLSQPAAR
jgi:biopolymer transport protein ExbD